jgi:hypothetical protein
MRDWIAVVMAVLGVLLVVAGGTLLVLNALATTNRAAPVAEPIDDAQTAIVPPITDSEATAGPVARGPRQPVVGRLAEAARRLPSADRLIGWGVVLLVLSAIAAGAITFNLQLAANS